MEFYTQTIFVDDRQTTLQIWETAGQERFYSLSPAFYRGADCCAFVYDVSSPTTFTHLERWRDEFLKNANPPNRDSFPFVVLGNKADLDDHRVSLRQAQQWCELNNNIPICETSAKDGSNVAKAFEELAKRAVQEAKKEPHFGYQCITLGETMPRRTNCYCK